MSVSSKARRAALDILRAMHTQLDKQVALVTGASKGIGRAIAIAYGQEHAKVAITYREARGEAEETAKLVRDAGGDALVVPFALEDPATAERAVKSVIDAWGSLNVLVNNAVQWPNGFQTIEELTFEEFTRTAHANMDGTFAMIKAAVPRLKKAAWGRIVTITTGLVEDGFPGAMAYVTGKSALHGLHRVLAKELGPSGILTNVLMAGAVDTRPRPPEFLQKLRTSAVTGRLTEADEVARATVFLGSPANGHISGAAIRCDGFYVSPHK
ncbi:MAG: SDR family oxidoreductase [Archangium sp.]